MSLQLISRSPDLRRLQEEGFDLAIQAGHLVIRKVPYLDGDGEVQRGTLMSVLTLSGDQTAPPATHVVHFSGGYPHDQDGNEILGIKHQSGRKVLAEGLVVDHSFSSKPRSGAYADYYEKITTYAAILANPAAAVDPDATPRVYPVIQEEKETTFEYVDTSSSRAGIGAASEKLKGQRVAIVGLGGTGSYVLDFLAKTPVLEIHLFDGDYLFQHNAFRAPGAPPVEDLRKCLRKVGYFAGVYSKMRRNIIPHEYCIDSTTIHLLFDFDFVFFCVDDSVARMELQQPLTDAGVPFIDVGMGLEFSNEGGLGGVLRVTTVSAKKSDHLERRVPAKGEPGKGEYTSNIQVAELNALTAALAVIKWKKSLGFYRELGNEHFTTFTIDVNELLNEEEWTEQ